MAYVARPGTDYNMFVSMINERKVVRRRLGGRTWEYLGPKRFVTYKPSGAQQPMQLLVNTAVAGTDIWFVRTQFMTRTHRKMQLIAEGTKAELWDLFLTYQNMLESQ